MASTRTPGITIGIDGRRFIDKRYHGFRIGMRVGAATQEQAEHAFNADVISSPLFIVGLSAVYGLLSGYFAARAFNLIKKAQMV